MIKTLLHIRFISLFWTDGFSEWRGKLRIYWKEWRQSSHCKHVCLSVSVSVSVSISVAIYLRDMQSICGTSINLFDSCILNRRAQTIAISISNEGCGRVNYIKNIKTRPDLSKNLPLSLYSTTSNWSWPTAARIGVPLPSSPLSLNIWTAPSSNSSVSPFKGKVRWVRE